MVSHISIIFLATWCFQHIICEESPLSPDDLKSSIKVGGIVVSLTSIDDPYYYPVGGYGVVNRYRSCGGPGQLLQMRYETCSGDHTVTCQVPADNVPRLAELHFAPSGDIYRMGVRVIAMTQGISPTNVFEKVLDNQELYRGNRYSLNAHVGASKMFRGRVITLVFEIFREDDFVEVCSMGDFAIV